MLKIIQHECELERGKKDKTDHTISDSMSKFVCIIQDYYIHGHAFQHILRALTSAVTSHQEKLRRLPRDGGHVGKSLLH